MLCRYVVFTVLLLIGILHASECSDILSVVTKKFDRIERWSDGKKFIWDVNVSISFEMDPHAYSKLQKLVTQSGGQLLDRSYTYETSFQITAARKGDLLVISGKGTNGRLDTPIFLFIDKEFYVVGTCPIYSVPTGVKPDQITEAYIFACRRSLLYDCVFPQPFLMVEPGDCFLYGLLVNASPLRFYSDSPKVTTHGRLVRLEGYGTILNSKIVLDISKSTNSLVSITNKMFQSEGYEKKTVYYFNGVKQSNSVEIYERIKYEKLEISPEQRRKVVVNFNLKQIQPLSERDMEITLPIGTLIHDFRRISKDWNVQDYSTHFSQGNWNRVVRYVWQGALPDEKKVEQLAYQQGNLIPPEAPRRRFSPLLFAPAMVFFALAAYFYLRNRRR